MDDIAQLTLLQDQKKEILTRLHQKIFGQDWVIEQLLITLFAGGHALFVGVPGLAKTLLISTLSEVMALSFNRIQFTPDLMPSDITGTDILEEDKETGRRHFRFAKGPIFTGLLLADEVNRTPPKTQAALLQAMQEKRVTVSGVTYPLPRPFHVFATENPVEQEGTYPLPEAQLDRFMLMIDVDYPSFEEEVKIAQYHPPTTLASSSHATSSILDANQLLSWQALTTRVPVAETLVRDVVRLVRSTRPQDPLVDKEDAPLLNFGAGPRGVQNLIAAAQASALLAGRPAVDVDDIQKMVLPVLQHRLVLSFRAEAEKITAKQILTRLMERHFR